MIKAFNTYTILCDNCGVDLCENDEFSGWDDIDWLIQGADEANWYTEDGKHYCEECYSWDDEDKLVLDETRKKVKQ